MEQILDTNQMAPEVPQTLSPEEMAKLLADQPVTTDDTEPTDAERVLH